MRASYYLNVQLHLPDGFTLLLEILEALQIDKLPQQRVVVRAELSHARISNHLFYARHFEPITAEPGSKVLA